MAATPAYLEFLLEHLAPLGEITTRRMFGVHCLYCDSAVFALLAGNTLYLKADAETRDVFLARKLEQFHPFGDEQMSMNYFQPPPEFFEDADALQEWGRLAIAAGSRAKPNKKKPAVKKRIVRR